MSNTQRVDRLEHPKSHHRHISPVMHAGLCLVTLGLSYLFISLAINSGSLWQYSLAFILFMMTLANATKVYKRLKVRKK